MKTVHSVLFLSFVALFIQSTLGFTSGINAVVSSLADYQTQSGGFGATKDAEPSLESTSHALFLSSLFGLRDKINSGDATSFIESLKNPDHGYSNRPGQPSDLESVKHALLGLTHLGKADFDTAALSAFILSLYDRDTKLFANTVGHSGDLKSTAVVFQCLSMLNLLQSASVTEKQNDIRKNLLTLVKTNPQKGTKYFSSITSDNYYAIVVAQHVGYEFSEIESWARYFQERQVTTGPLAGGFYSDKDYSDVDVEDAAHALSALHVLQQYSKSQIKLVDTINTEALIRYSSGLNRNLKAAALAYQAIARTRAFQSIFKIHPTYEVSNNNFRLTGDRIIQGVQVKPSLSMRTTYGLAHAGLDVSVTITHKASGDKKVKKLTWNSETQVYAADEFYDTADKLGEVTFDFVIRWLVVDLGDDLLLEISETKKVGYKFSVTPKATHAGKEIEPHGNIGFGAEFSFDLSLGTLKSSSLKSGDFQVVFTVLDSSDVAISRTVFQAAGNTKPISFSYRLDEVNIPAGDIKFTFGISNKQGVHTSESVSYVLPVPMVASGITFDGFSASEAPTYKIGDTVKVHIEPATLPDLRTPHYYSNKDTLGNAVTRKFFMDISSFETQAVLYSLSGVVSLHNDHQRYTFTLPVQATFDAIGANVVSFHYETANGKKIELQNFDAELSELYEDSVQLNYTVQTELHLVDLKNAPNDGVLDYGNEVKFTFKVLDTIGKEYIFAGSELATVYLSLRHKADDHAGTFSSHQQAAVQIFDEKDGTPSHFQISWSVNPNAVKGKGFLQLVALGADGKDIPLYQEKSMDVWKVNVEIGGKIDVESQTYTQTLTDDVTIYFVEFELSCNKKLLTDAKLKSTITLIPKPGQNTTLFSDLPVTHGTEAGHYQVSWLLTNPKGGDYVVDFYREVDHRRIQEGEHTQSNLSPLFSETLRFTPDTGSILPFKTEFLILLILGGAFAWTAFKKMDIEATKKQKKK